MPKNIPSLKPRELRLMLVAGAAVLFSGMEKAITTYTCVLLRVGKE